MVITPSANPQGFQRGLRMKRSACWLAGIIGAGFIVSAAVADTLDGVKQRGSLRCGVNSYLPGFSQKGEDGVWRGLDVDLCRAVAAAVLGDADKVEFMPLSATTRFEALQNGSIDVLSHNATWTMSRDIEMGLEFAGTNYYDGQGFLVHKSMNIRSALELDGADVCVQAGTTSLQNVKQYFAQNRMKLRLHVLDSTKGAIDAYESEECSVYTSDQSALHALRVQLKDPDASVVLPEFISKEPLGPVVREGDDRWGDIVEWTLFAMINAEELGISSLNVERVRTQAENPALRRFLGAEGNQGAALGLDAGWVYRIIAQVGNYGESFDRNVGDNSPLKISRSQNALWRQGGLLFAPPVL